MSDQSQALDQTVGRDALVQIVFRNQNAVRFRVRCKVGAWRRSYGRVEFNVSPVFGEGSAWVSQGVVEIRQALQQAPALMEVVSPGDNLYQEMCKRIERSREPKCHADRDGNCHWAEGCPQIRDGEPDKSGRHCPLDSINDSDGV